jgi:hypothetical protein
VGGRLWSRVPGASWVSSDSASCTSSAGIAVARKSDANPNRQGFRDHAPDGSPAGVKFGTRFTKSDQVSVFDAIRTEAKADEEVVRQALANPFDNFALAFRPKVQGLMLDRMGRNQEIVTRYLNDPEFKAIVDQELARRTYDEIRGGESPTAG